MSLPTSALCINFRTLLNPVTAFFTPSRKPTPTIVPHVNCKTNNKNVRDHKVVTSNPLAKRKKHMVPTKILHILQTLNRTEWFDLLLMLGACWITTPQRNK
jgi:hypothetical protein